MVLLVTFIVAASALALILGADSLRSLAMPFDADLQLKDSGSVTSSAAAQVGGSDQVLDMGADSPGGAGMFVGSLVLDVASLTTDDEHYQIILQGADNEDFDEGVRNLGMFELGDVQGGAGGGSTTGRFVIPVTNLFQNEPKRYLRLYTEVSGTAPDIDYEAYLSKPMGMGSVS